ncbi:CpaF family protein [Endozoicomonadaceae bacterium StTr2]
MYQNQDIYLKLRSKIFAALDATVVSELAADALREELKQAVDTLVEKDHIQVPVLIRTEFVERLVHEIKGLGPLQPLIDDDSVSDIMVNGTESVYVERDGLLTKTDVAFIDNKQLLDIAHRIAAQAGRRVDESSPLCDTRLPDGSRVNIAIPPITLDGPVISIRKFGGNEFELGHMVDTGTLSLEMAQLLAVAAYSRLNILISGGTGSGKTTLLNALSRHISDNERVITIEDAAELKLKQPHVIRMETRPPGIENTGVITQRDLVINSLRMRPDRIIVGECRGPEAFEMLQAMNTGHDGSMSTLHANSPRDALGRVESMVMMASHNMPLEAIRRSITSAVDLLVQIARLHDGSRRIMSISEVMGIEGDSVVLEEIFRFQPDTTQSGARITGQFTTPGLIDRSILKHKARFFGMGEALDDIFAGAIQ